ncbi:nitroreductase family protein [Streptomyces sp. NPDC005989]|uniref:nitroreductase family protein n=1 Tax=Streptomyces sp. NPDC005989 TaxID=3156727 RepID=UPI0033E02AC6
MTDGIRGNGVQDTGRDGPGKDHATVLDYVEAVRERLRQPLDDEEFTPDWSDRPSPHTTHPGAPEILLPTAVAAGSTGTFADAVTYTGASQRAEAPGLTFEGFAEALQLTAGILARRWQIDWNGDAEGRSRLRGAAWGRGTPSGGANYPWELYWAAAPGLPVLPGLLHYASGRHTLERLSTGDPTAAIRAALAPTSGEPQAGPSGIPHGDGSRPTGGYLICTLRPWKTAFKYGTFAYHVATLDIGAFLGSWSLLEHAAARPFRALLDFDESAMNTALGLDPGQESAHAVIPLAWHRAERHRPAATGVPPAANANGPARPRPWEISRQVKEVPGPAVIRRATAGTSRGGRSGTASEARSPAVPAPRAVATAPLPSLRLPGAVIPGQGLGELLSRRRSSVGRIDPRTPVTTSELSLALRCAATATGERSVIGIRVIAQRVEGLAPGSYRYDAEQHALFPVGTTHRLGEHDYAMRNYSVAQAGAVIAFVWRPARALAALGPNSYRAAHAEAGAAAQYLHLAAQAAGLGCGLILGMDPRAVDLAVTGGEEGEAEVRTSLCAFLGARMPGAAGLDDRLV